MFRATEGSMKFKFSTDCPNYVKANIMQRCLAAIEMGRVATVPPLYQRWVTVIETRVHGRMLPIIGFVSDERIVSICARIRSIVRM